MVIKSMSSLREESTPPSAWYFLALLTSLNVINFIDRQLITSLQIPLREDPQLRLTDLQNQLLAGYAFSIVYSIAGLYLGTLADRKHRPRMIALGLFVWSAATLASGFAQNFWQLAIARIFVAFGESTLTPAGIAMLADVFRPRQRSLAFGLYYLGIPIGASLCLIIANLLWPIPWVGWRGCFIGLGVVGLSMVGFLLLVKDPPRGATETQASTAFPPLSDQRRSFIGLCGEIWSIMCKTPALPMTMLGAICMNIGVGATWLDSSWLHAERGFSKQGAPIFLGIVFLFGGCFGNIFGGWLGDFFNRYRSGGRLLAVVASQLVVAPFAIAFRFLPGDSYFMLALCGFFSFILVTIWYGPVLATVQELTPVRFRATTVAILLIGLNILGASLGAVVAALLSKALESYTWGIFLAAQASLIAIPLFIFAYRRYETDLARATS